MPSALANLKALDFSRVLAGAFATMMLPDLGAAQALGGSNGGGAER